MATAKPNDIPAIVEAAMVKLNILPDQLSRFYVSDTRVYLYLKNGDRKVVERSKLDV